VERALGDEEPKRAEEGAAAGGVSASATGGDYRLAQKLLSNQHPAYVAFVMDEMRDVLHEPNAPIRDFLAKDRVLAMLDNRARYERHLWV
jgi:hypothetical protein